MTLLLLAECFFMLYACYMLMCFQAVYQGTHSAASQTHVFSTDVDCTSNIMQHAPRISVLDWKDLQSTCHLQDSFLALLQEVSANAALALKEDC